MPDLNQQIPAEPAEITFDPGSPTHTADWFRSEHQDLVPIKYVENIGWHVWTGKVWRPDPEGVRTKAVVGDFIRMLNRTTFGQPYNRKYTLENSYLNNVMVPLQLSTMTPAENMDALPSVLNCQNGVLDLSTFELTPHDHNLNLTMITRAEYTGEVDPVWSAFMEEILPDEEVRRYLQRLVGVSLLGNVLLHTLPILYGQDGANGKSTLIESLAHALGSYAHTAESTLLMTGAGDAQSASPATLMLKGKRVVTTSETEEGKKLASAFVKQITGGDSLTARALHKMPVTWEPTHSVFLLTNYKPVVDGNDKALFRRLKLIPFLQNFEGRADPGLKERMKLYGSSILSWAVEGLKDYQANGIKEPAAVTGATSEYRGENDATGSFIKEHLEFGTGTVTVTELNDLLHVFQQDIDPKYRTTSQRLNRALREGGAVQSKKRIDGKPTNVWNGVRLKDDDTAGIEEL